MDFHPGKPELVLEVPVQNCAGEVSRGTIWIFKKQSSPTNLSQTSASLGKLNFIF
jgi:hypothetical protein